METVSVDQATKLGLTPSEFEKIKELIGREPNFTELGIFSAMWNEHCSYKSSRVWLSQLPTKNKYVIQGPGENAGVIDIGDNDVAIFKIESHNHPSYIEPYQGAATGVGGILRDIFTMGARPVANLNSIRFGRPEHAKTKYLLNGVVSGIAGYGNCMGIPTVGGEVEFDECYDGNILVNAMNIGIAKKDKVFLSIASGVGNPVIYVGSKTGRDGIHGASMASQEFDDNSEAKKPTVQVGDPFAEKLLLEACLELMKTDTIVSIQDMGAAGLTSSSVEMASKGKLGIEINLNKVPCREENMQPFELMLSESQERMLIVLKEGKEKDAEKIFKKWDLDFSVIGKMTDNKNLVLHFKDEIVCDIPITSLADEAPKYNREWESTPLPQEIDMDQKLKDLDIKTCLKQLLSHENQANKMWVWEQYDHMVMGDTIQKPGGDAAVVRVHGTNKALAASVDCTPRYCLAHPFTGGMQAVCETYRNLSAVGAKPRAITNCLNFGNPEKKEIMGQFVDVIKGIKEACTKLDYPVISGNVSLYNETNGVGIKPTPTIGGVGLIQDVNNTMTYGLKSSDNLLIVVGETKGHVHQSALCHDILYLKKGPPPTMNLEEEKKNSFFIRGLIEKKLAQSVHDVSDGGIALAIAEMCMAGKIGAKISTNLTGPERVKYLFGEDQARYVIEIKQEHLNNLVQIAKEQEISMTQLGSTNLEQFAIDEIKISVDEMIKLNNNWFYNYNSN
ncbi:phosphoribosylformylglycinamidine synthase, synthetase subunit [Candidatus Pelagibacter sp. IMCC9063]|uniref:phosphoribosylformylglycinamidine synthase subunit PurL n=1 Tax=Pelagibacter sp. (strain IMCC9063) TaxID=1002672 RepID=UPI00020463B8|nr:phosphoribosylformylglycinamidine synthase subunit PurL [Candidatus Pelagibacter sp. IMCC9063]AEA81735.1 phosphoribosylformylglycinamidine synthase, synthetase subunit [Candidatus Pelagibacter sp. IMCC9063]